MRDRKRRTIFVAAAVVAAMLLAPVGALAGKPTKAPPCTVSAGVTITSTKVKGKAIVTITGTAGDDTIDCHSAGSTTGVTVHSGGGRDEISGTDGADLLYDDSTTPGNQAYIYGYGGGDIIHAGYGLFGSATTAIVSGGAGNDTIIAHGGFLSVSGGDGDDSLDLKLAYGAQASGDAGNDIILGPAEAVDDTACIGCFNQLDGGTGNDQIYGGNGRDEIGGGPGTDEMYGGGGMDALTDYGSGSEVFDCGDGENDLAGDYDGNGVATDGTVGYLNAPEDDSHPGCESIRVAVSGG